MIAAWVGDNDLACEQLGVAVRYPGPSQLWPIEAAPVLGSGVRRRENGMILIIGFRKRF